MKKIPLLTVLPFLFFACHPSGKDSHEQAAKPQEDSLINASAATFVEHVVDFAITNKNGQAIELPQLYDSLVTTLPADSLEKSILAEALAKKGFEKVDWGRGNYPPLGPRMVLWTLQKGHCRCEVGKIYYSTIADNLFEVRERIHCMDSVTSHESLR